jgi:hypothetical protein
LAVAGVLLTLVVLVVTVWATWSSPAWSPIVRTEIIRTPLGTANVRCGGQYTPSCADAELNYDICTTEVNAFVATIKGPRLEQLDKTLRQMVGSGPPHGGEWTTIDCGRPESPATSP